MHLKSICTLLFLLYFGTNSFSQNSQDYNLYTSTNIETGYSYNFGEPNNRNFHILSLGLNKTTYGGRHGGGFAYGIGTDIGLNTKNFTIGPKINGFIYYQFIVIGSELVAYTDFKQTTTRYVPIIGIGGEKFKLTINPQVILSNKNFQPIDKGTIQLTVNFPLDRKQIKPKK